MTVSYKDYKLDTAELVLDVDDTLTYALLCYAGPKIVLEQITPILGNKLAPGPLAIKRY